MVLDGKSSWKYLVNAGIPGGSIICPTLFLLYINNFPDDVICVDDTTLNSKCDQASGLLNLNLIYEILWTGVGSCLLISMLEKLNLLHLVSIITLVLLIWKLMSLFLTEKSSFKVLYLTFSSKLDGALTLSPLLKLPRKKWSLDSFHEVSFSWACSAAL